MGRSACVHDRDLGSPHAAGANQELRCDPATRWCWAGVALVLLLPFIAVHYRCDGLEDEPMLRLHVASEAVQFEADDRADHPADHETTVFAQTPASIDQPDAFGLGLDMLLSLVLAMLPLVLAMARLIVPIVRATPSKCRRRAARRRRHSLAAPAANHGPPPLD
jgi:hypothetical protein